MRKALLLIASHVYLGDEIPLALVVNPSICDALSHLLRHADEYIGAHVSQDTPVEYSFRNNCGPFSGGDAVFSVDVTSPNSAPAD